MFRCVTSIEILRRSLEGRVADRRLIEWLRRVLPALQQCELLSLRCLLEELSGEPRYLREVLYGLARLRDAVFAERSVDFFDYAVVVRTVSQIDGYVAEALAGSLAGYFDSGDMLASELSYHVYWLLVFRHQRLPDGLREVLGLAQYSPDPIVACRARSNYSKKSSTLKGLMSGTSSHASCWHDIKVGKTYM